MSERMSPMIRQSGLVLRFLSRSTPTNTNPAKGIAIENPTSVAKEISSAVVIGAFVSNTLGFTSLFSSFSTSRL
ncbi:MAG: hypothetical protein JWP09_481 [Candidatus Taylorbacteria bacterium]|nr:hypothetical protein [Candidatus Taylorbacteria bacterium]